ncbi:E3 ubiquitin-protein ligase RBBP6 [Gossypium australe]|uniref:E3 ubiquitin-protein ligase RBBP6 n=1 Tax=Gossypium australe TaxID=47621 RepID=A0A5B6UV72_9ROSI|nr:E3 ubiquitin-protein ligase RBBP6 [Gossypium australe]
MNEWFSQYLRTNPAVQQAQAPPPTPSVPEIPQGTSTKFVRKGKATIQLTIGGILKLQLFQKKKLHGNSFRPSSERNISVRGSSIRREEFLELKQGNRSVSKNEREFVPLSKYAQEWVQSEAEMCKRFEEGLNEEIKLLKYQDRSTSATGYSGRERGSQRTNPRPSTPSVTSVGTVKSRCQYYNKVNFGECRLKSGACYRCDSFDHFLRACPERIEKKIEQTLKPSNPISRVRPPRPTGNVSGSRGVTKDTAGRSEA